MCLPRESTGDPGDTLASDFHPESVRCCVLSLQFGMARSGRAGKPHLLSLDSQRHCKSPKSQWEGDRSPTCPPETHVTVSHIHTRFKLISPFLTCPTRGTPTS